MNTAEIISIVMGIVGFITTCLSYYFAIRYKIKSTCEDAINNAEESGQSGEEKLELAAEQVYAIIPTVAKPFFSKALVRRLVQATFDKIKAFAEKQNMKEADTK